MICFIVAPEIVSVFRKDRDVLAVGVVALRFMCVSMLLLPTSTIANMTFQSIGKSANATFLACMQNGLLFVPMVIVLEHFTGVLGIEMAKPISFVLAAVISVPIIMVFIRGLDGEKYRVKGIFNRHLRI